MINVAVIGCGYWGPNIIRNFSQIESTNLYYICDLDEKKLQSMKGIYPSVKTTNNYKEVLEDPNVHAVAVVLPVAMHFPIAKEALLHDKHVLIEKPMTATVEESEELIRIAKEKNKIIMVDHTFEYAEAINKMKEIIKLGELGDIYYIRAEWLNLGLLQPDVNVIWDLATHVISMISYIADIKPVSISANGGAYIRKDIPEIANVHIKYPTNVTAYVTVSWLEPKKTRLLTVVGSKKMLVFDLTNTDEQVKIYDKGVDLTNVSGDTTQMRINYRSGDLYSPNIKNVEPLKAMCSHFADCVINSKNPRSDGESGLTVVKVLQATEESLKNGGKEVILK